MFSKTTIKELKSRYRAVLLYCALLALAMAVAAPAQAAMTGTTIGTTTDTVSNVTSAAVDDVATSTDGTSVSGKTTITQVTGNTSVTAVTGLTDNTVASLSEVQGLADTVDGSGTGTATALDSTGALNGATNLVDGVNKVNDQVTTNTANIATNTTDIATNTTNIATNTTNIATNTGNINTLMGSDTTDGSVLYNVKNRAQNADYTNTTSGLTATTIGEAIDEVAATANTNKTNIGSLTYDNTMTVDYGTETANTNLTDAISQVSSNIGSSVTSTNTIAADKTVNENLSALDTAIGAAVTDGTVIKNTNSVNQNLQAIDNTIGSDIGADANTVLSGVTIGDGTDKTSIAAALGKVNNAIGASVTNGVAVESNNTVNENLQALDTKIGVIAAGQNKITNTNTVAANLTALDTAIGTTDWNTSNGWLTADTSVTSAVNALDAAIGDQSVMTAGTNVASSTTSVASAVNQLDTAIGDRTITSRNEDINNALANNVASAFTATGNAIGDMDFSGSRYISGQTDLSGAVRTLDTAVGDLNSRVNKVESQMKSGFASTAALSALVPNARSAGNTQFSIGSGIYRDRVGGAAGLFHYVNDNVLLNAGVSYGGDHSTMGRVGATFGW